MRILVGMSGGLDSTLAAHLLMKEGHAVEGACLAAHEWAPIDEAKRAAEKLGIPLHILDGRERFSALIEEDFAREYATARTPNPCIDCNRLVKFAMLCDFARENGFDKAATGHYCHAERTDDGVFCIRRADTRKDQSYMLWRLTQEQLKTVMFPLADYDKDTVRQMAFDAGFDEVAQAKESQEICFIPDGDYAGFIERRLGIRFDEGDFIDGDGNIVGRHRGIIRYTVGQRKRLGIALGQPVFVSRIDALTNTVTVLPDREPNITRAEADTLNFQLFRPSVGKTETIKAFVKLRYAAPPIGVTVEIDADADIARLCFDEPVKTVTPGQSAVVYDADGRVLMGGKLR